MTCPSGVYRSNRTLGELGLVDNGHAAAHSSLHITPSRLQVTSEDNFWTAMLWVQALIQRMRARNSSLLPDALACLLPTWHMKTVYCLVPP